MTSEQLRNHRYNVRNLWLGMVANANSATFFRDNLNSTTFLCRSCFFTLFARKKKGNRNWKEIEWKLNELPGK
jgi:hypothetical protein